MTKMSRSAVKDRLLIKALRIEEGWSVDRMIAEFPARQWKRQSNNTPIFSGPPCIYSLRGDPVLYRQLTAIYVAMELV